MRNLLTTQNLNCYREQIEKETFTRLAWKSRYGLLYPTCFVSQRTRDLGVRRLAHTQPSPGTLARPALRPALPAVPAVVRPAGGRSQAAAAQEPRQSSLSEAPLMRPVTPQTRDDLYHGLSKDGMGRSLYLRRRTLKGPEEKFDYPLLSSWDYGWRLGDYEQSHRALGNGRSTVVRNTFYARNGIFNIPSATDRLG